MAMYEHDGFCPNNSFWDFEAREKDKVSKLWVRAREIFGDRLGYMVYTPYGYNTKGETYVVDALVGCNSTMNIEIATCLSMLIPNCTYSKEGKKILITDLINDGQIPDVAFIFEDDRYICGILEEDDKVHMYFYKK